MAMDGVRWTLTAEFAPRGLYTMAQVVDADGHRWGGGMGGPPLWPGSRVNSAVHLADRGPHLIVLRVAGEPLSPPSATAPARISDCMAT